MSLSFTSYFSCTFYLTNRRKERLGQKRLTPRNKKEFMKIAFQIFVNFSLFPKELLLLPPFIRV
ncbi:hypothetical protein DSH74_13550 [Enterococcus faecium]|nr:hypothetical protein [Enterococcus faecium]EGP5464691.1 hypothetical protein [Enterococcus faecium]EGP5697016.1 hypothetical protein [Enterococcus faecium]